MGTSVLYEVKTERGVFCMLLLLYLCCSGGKCELQESQPAQPSNRPTVKPFNNEPQAFPEEERASLPVFTMDYPRIQVPFEFTLWILLASFAKIGTFGWIALLRFLFVHKEMIALYKAITEVYPSFSSLLQVSTFTIKSLSGSLSPAS